MDGFRVAGLLSFRRPHGSIVQPPSRSYRHDKRAQKYGCVGGIPPPARRTDWSDDLKAQVHRLIIVDCEPLADHFQEYAHAEFTHKIGWVEQI